MIIIGSDHGGFELKEELKKYLDEKDIEFLDVGTKNKERAEYPDIATLLCEKVKKNKNNQGILICRSGIGMSIAANKFKGIRCGLCTTEEDAKFAKMHNDCNVISMGADRISTHTAVCIVRMFLATSFEGGRHLDRVNMITDIEKLNK